jgi:FixJ family two-component response regulator
MASDQADTVFLVDDDPVIRASYAALVSTIGIPFEEFPSAEEFLNRVDLTRSGCAVVDLCLSGLSGLGLHRHVVEARSDIPVILVSAYWSTNKVIEAMTAGVFSALEKPFDADALIQAIRSALRANCEARQKKRCEADVRRRLDQLHPREKAVLDMILAGHPNKALQHRLRVSRRTVERDRAAILEKTQALSFLELATMMARAGIVPVEACN